MRIKELLIDFYQELKDDNNQIYDTNGIRSEISSKAEKLLNIIDKKDQQCMCIDKRIFSFLNFINGYDTPRYEDNMYLFNNTSMLGVKAQAQVLKIMFIYTMNNTL